VSPKPDGSGDEKPDAASVATLVTTTCTLDLQLPYDRFNYEFLVDREGANIYVPGELPTPGEGRAPLMRLKVTHPDGVGCALSKDTSFVPVAPEGVFGTAAVSTSAAFIDISGPRRIWPTPSSACELPRTSSALRFIFSDDGSTGYAAIGSDYTGTLWKMSVAGDTCTSANTGIAAPLYRPTRIGWGPKGTLLVGDYFKGFLVYDANLNKLPTVVQPIWSGGLGLLAIGGCGDHVCAISQNDDKHWIWRYELDGTPGTGTSIESLLPNVRWTDANYREKAALTANGVGYVTYPENGTLKIAQVVAPAP